MARPIKRNYQAELGKKISNERAELIDELIKCKEDFTIINQFSYSGSCEHTVADMKQVADSALCRIDRFLNYLNLLK